MTQILLHIRINDSNLINKMTSNLITLGRDHTAKQVFILTKSLSYTINFFKLNDNLMK